MVFLSLSARLEVNVEAFNAVESIGNLTKHRRAPMIIPTERGYRLIYVPAVSGEAIANAYQRALVELAKIIYPMNKLSTPLTEWDERGEFIKFADDNHLTPELKNIISRGKSAKTIADIQQIKHEFEKVAIKQSIVCDVGGFLYAGELPVKRTSRIYTGYMLPVYDAIDITAIEAQLHARHMHSETRGTSEREERREEEREKERREERATQMIYYVEVSSTIYGLSISLDLSGIGTTSLVKIENILDKNEKMRRIKIAVAALQTMFLGTGLGAKISRFAPIKRVISSIATISHPTNFTVSPAQIKDYINNTIDRVAYYRETLRKLGIEPEFRIMVYGETPKKISDIDIVETKEPEEFFSKLLDKTIELCNKYC